MGDFYQITLKLQILSNSIIIKDWILHNRICKIRFHSSFERLVLPQNTLIIAS